MSQVLFPVIDGELLRRGINPRQASAVVGLAAIGVAVLCKKPRTTAEALTLALPCLLHAIS